MKTKHSHSWVFLHVVALLLRPVVALQHYIGKPSESKAESSRRNALATMLSGAVLIPIASWDATANAATRATTASARDQLLDAIARKDTDEEMITLIEGLKDPSKGVATYSDRLEGCWELIWSYKAENFSPLLKLPQPLRPESYQYFGTAAASEVGEGRIAQGLTGGVLGSSQLWLSSGSIPLSEDPSILEIQPPFRFELGGRYGTGKPKKAIVDAGSDAEFRELNARTKEAQQAPKNQYKQVYVEDNGPGSLRVSTVVSGDPVIVGLIFVHRKLG
jgi:hypothetical protein